MNSGCKYSNQWVSVVGLGLLCALFACSVAGREYCQFEMFNASCSVTNQVVLMEEARYGRLRLGRCVTHDYGFLGCSINVLDLFDRICSGRQRCQFNIPALRELVHPCPKDLTCYLEATYRCITVVARQQMLPCNSTVQLTSNLPTLYAMGFVTSPDGGHNPQTTVPSPTEAITPVPFTPICPVTFQARPGQRLQLSLYIFGSQRDDKIQNVRPTTPASVSERPLSLSQRSLLNPTDLQQNDMSGTCPVSINVVEGYITNNKTQSPQISEDICRPLRNRERHLYTTNSTTAHVFITDVHVIRKQHPTTYFNRRWNFILKLEAIGCPDVTAPPSASLNRTNERLVVRCDFTLETWHLTCKGNAWVGSFTNCSDVVQPSNSEVANYTRRRVMPLGLVIAIVVGIVLGIIIGALLLISLFVFKRRRRCTNSAAHDSSKALHTTLCASNIDYVQRVGQDLTVEPTCELFTAGYNAATLNALYACPIHGFAATSVGDLTSLATMPPYIYVATDSRKRKQRCHKDHECKFHTNKQSQCRHVTPPGSSQGHRRNCSLLTDSGRVFCTVNSCHHSPCFQAKHKHDFFVRNESPDQPCQAHTSPMYGDEICDEQTAQQNQHHQQPPSIILDLQR